MKKLIILIGKNRNISIDKTGIMFQTNKINGRNRYLTWGNGKINYSIGGIN